MLSMSEMHTDASLTSSTMEEKTTFEVGPAVLVEIVKIAEKTVGPACLRS